MSPTGSAHLVPLGPTGWSLWREGGLRSAGFPADLLEAVRDAGTYDTAGLSAAVARIAADPRFREAVAWQNPALIATCLDKLVRGEPRNVRGRLHESTVVRYVQRYALKNDTIGFFGPVGWATLSPDVAGLTVVPGDDVIARRTVHFEVWAIDEVARALARRPELSGALRPRKALAVAVRDGVLLRPLRPPVELSEAEAAAFDLCDGVRTVQDIGSEALERLAKLGAIHIGLEGPMHSWPEELLRAKLHDAHALESLDELIAARDTLGAARSAEEVVEHGQRLAEIFESITGSQSTRRPGEAYAGRTLVYLDSRRDVEVVLGRTVIDALAAPLGLLLDSARWLVARAGRGFHDLFLSLYRAESARTGSRDVALGLLIAMAATDLTASTHSLPGPVKAAVEEFQERWARVLSGRTSVAAVDIAEAVGREFGDAVAPWRTAVHHSPDILIAAADAQAVERGDFQLVLGELHMAINSLDNRFFVQHHDDPSRLMAAAEADFDGRRVYAALPKNSPFVSSRVWPPIALQSPHYTYWSWSGEPSSVDPPGPVIAGADLTVRLDGAALLVTEGRTGRQFPLLEVLAEILSTAVVNAFRPLAPAAHNPRITIDRLVVSRESWTFPAASTQWAYAKDEEQRYAAARRWRTEQGLPERVFAVLPVERKPIGVDFGSVALVNMLAKEVRRTAEAGAPAFTVSEMLPDLGQLWLPDRAGRRYACEFRLVAVDGRG